MRKEVLTIENIQKDLNKYFCRKIRTLLLTLPFIPIANIIILNIILLLYNPEYPFKTIFSRMSNVAAGKDTDCVSRSFCPKLAVAEDPVCGSAHCQIADYWSRELGKKTIYAYQASKRGGYLHCELSGNGRISISGEAVLVAISDIIAEL